MHELRFGLIYSRLHEEVAIPEFAGAAEDLGFAALWVTDGLVNEQSALDPLVALQAFADHTREITVGTCVVVLPLRNPVVLAKQVASVDLLSNGRTVLGIGVGGSANSGRSAFAACGVAPEVRGLRTDESLEVMKKLWSGEAVSHHGRFHDFDDVRMEPAPLQRPHPPIWSGGGDSVPVLMRTARACAGWVPTDLTPEGYASAWSMIEDYCGEAGTDPGRITKALHIYLSLDDDPDAARRAAERTLTERYGFPPTLAPDSRYAFGTSDDVASVIRRFAAVGVTDFVLNVTRPLPEVWGQVERFHREVMSQFDAVPK
jgi:probable F420-dependent oxidoreductase